MPRERPRQRKSRQRSAEPVVASPAGSGLLRAHRLRLGVLVLLGATLGWLGYQAQSAWWDSRETPGGEVQTTSPDPDAQAGYLGSCCGLSDGKFETESPPSFVAPPGVVPGVNQKKAPAPAPEGMAWIPGGIFWRGSDTRGHRDSRPWHLVEVAGFWMDVSPVTNEQFARFVKATGYVTVAERTPKAEDFPGAPPEKLVPGSLVFTPTAGPVKLDDYLRWRKWTPGANWRRAGVFLSVIQLSSFLTA